ncbi:hypothetical protein [Allosphingosinicella sp.]|jgi:hypothetical protein|uniref:hypothetical protein n=1 Tax=Allosphingosinicella sp. TaxID=2823234 RepID=UPI002EE02CEF
MDMAFLVRAERLLDRRFQSGVDYGVLVATLAAHQSASPTGLAARARSGGKRSWQRPNEALVELLVAGPEWREAGRVQSGSFNPGAVRAASTARKGMSPARLPSHFSIPSALARYTGGSEAQAAWGQRDS